MRFYPLVSNVILKPLIYGFDEWVAMCGEVREISFRKLWFTSTCHFPYNLLSTIILSVRNKIVTVKVKLHDTCVWIKSRMSENSKPFHIGCRCFIRHFEYIKNISDIIRCENCTINDILYWVFIPHLCINCTNMCVSHWIHWSLYFWILYDATMEIQC